MTADGALPVDELLPGVAHAMAEGRNLVIEAAPGAGKTTRVPKHLLERDAARGKEILVLQPRRIAARAAARFVAASLGEEVGERCGYRVRFESKTSARTRLCFITEALLLRRLRDDPSLEGVGIVVFDELHERHLAGDVGLALLRRLQLARGSDAPRIVAMSATLDAEPIAAFLDAKRLRCEGRAHPVEIRHAPEPRRGERERRIEERVRGALRDVLADDPGGHVLVFLPGAREIRACEQACSALASDSGLEIRPLHGSLSSAEQDAVLGGASARKLVLATNIAETSLTIDGVRAVIDSGLARVARDDPWTGLPTLELAKISRASAAQRAGRAGRTAPGLCLRLYSRHDHDERPGFTPPEIARLELAGVLLDLYAAGVRAPSQLAWLDTPPSASIERAQGLLEALGAIGSEPGSELSRIGRAMLSLPVHPRHARLLVEAKHRGVGAAGAAAVALLSEGPLLRRGPRDDAGADLLEEIALFERVAGQRSEAGRRGIDGPALRRVRLLYDQLLRALRRVDIDAPATPAKGDAAEEALCMSITASHPDHVSRVRRGEAGQCAAVFAGGGAADIAPASIGGSTEWIVALAVEKRREGAGRETTRVHRCIEIEPDWLLDLFSDRIEEIDDLRFDPDRERIEGRSELRYAGLVLASSPLASTPPEASALLREAAIAAGPAAFVDSPDALSSLYARTALLAEVTSGFHPLGDEEAVAVLSELSEGRRSFGEIRSAGLIAHLRASLGKASARLDSLAPLEIALPRRRRVPVHYEPGKPPWIESRMQDFFGLREGPRVAEGRVALVLHLLAPNFRAVQVTTDLAGFWERHYPTLRKSLMRRYPRHAWPENPLDPPPHRSGKR